MSPAEAAKIRETLTLAREALLAEGPVAVDAADAGSASDEDEAPHREMTQAIASSRNRERDERLRRIDGALQRLAADPEAYGLCDVCEEPIPPGRLAVMPFARLCVACQGANEESGRKTRKKVTDYR